MKSLQTARVVVVDDAADEAWPIMQALSRAGIGATYVSGDRVEDLPPEPLSGIRLAFVDMKLNVEGSDKQVVSKTVRVLEHVLAKDSSPCLIVTWTKHRSMISSFRQALKARMPFLRPGVVLELEKPLAPDESDLQEIIDAIAGMVKEHWTTEVLWEWEGLAHRAASATTQLIASVAETEEAQRTSRRLPSTTSWQRAMKATIGALMRAEGGELKYDDTQHTLNFLRVLGALHLDCLEQSAVEWRDGNLSRCVWANVANLSVRGRDALNTRLVVSKGTPEWKDTCPGNIYIARAADGIKCPVVRFGVSGDVFTGERDPAWKYDGDWKRLRQACSNAEAGLRKIQRRPGTKEKRVKDAAKLSRGQNRKLRQRKAAILRDCRSAAVDVTPSCDHVQGKRRVARFVGGLLVPGKHEKLFALHAEDRIFLRAVPRFASDELGGVWRLIVNARHHYTMGNCRRLISSRPLCRLRAPILVDLQAWLAAHSARPGFASVE